MLSYVQCSIKQEPSGQLSWRSDEECMYEIQDREDTVKGCGWVLLPCTMAEQPIQQMVVGHMCFQDCTEQ